MLKSDRSVFGECLLSEANVVLYQAFNNECVTEKIFFLILNQTYVMGTQKNRLNETVLLSTQNIC